jgi:hypothetical protein
MPELLFFGMEISFVLGSGFRQQRDPFDDREPVSLDPGSFGRVVGQETHGPDPQVIKNLRSNPVVAGIDRKTEIKVGLDGVAALILQVIGLEFVE